MDLPQSVKQNLEGLGFICNGASIVMHQDNVLYWTHTVPETAKELQETLYALLKDYLGFFVLSPHSERIPSIWVEDSEPPRNVNGDLAATNGVVCLIPPAYTTLTSKPLFPNQIDVRFQWELTLLWYGSESEIQARLYYGALQSLRMRFRETREIISRVQAGRPPQIRFIIYSSLVRNTVVIQPPPFSRHSWNVGNILSVGRGSGSCSFLGVGDSVVQKSIAAIGFGTLRLVGHGLAQAGRTATGIGTVVFNGSGSAIAGVVLLANGAGTVSFSSQGQAQAGRTATGSGGLAITSFGEASSSSIFVATGSGSVVLNGTGSAQAGRTGTGSGSFSLIGSGIAVSGPVIAGIGSGSLSFSGFGSAQAGRTATGTGSLQIVSSGQAEAVTVIVAAGSGSFVLTGSGNSQAGRTGTGSGSLQITSSGTAVAGTVHTATGSGSFSIASAGNAQAGRTATGAGSFTVTSSGSGSVTTVMTGTGSGAFVLTGVGSAQAGRTATGTGTLVLSGSGSGTVSGSVINATGSGSLSIASSGVASALRIDPLSLNILFVVDAPNGSQIDQATESFLQGLGCTVTTVFDTSSIPANYETTFDAVYVSSSVSSGSVNDNYWDSTIGVVIGEAFNWDADDASLLSGNGTFVTDNDSLEIEPTAHPITSGLLTGVSYQYYSINERIAVAPSPGDIPSSAATLARVAGTTAFTLFVYESGATAANGFVVPGRRVAFPTAADDNLLTFFSRYIFRQCIAWAAGVI